MFLTTIKSTLLTAICVLAGTFVQTDINGKWKGTINDQFEVNYEFKVDGEKLTGTASSPRGNDPIKKGFIKGDSLSFALEIMDTEMTITGKIKSAELITLTMAGGPGGPGGLSFDIKKAK
ncbi:MAG: hypothetical protein QM731_03090 [Chitinophagaceae bacterium]